MKQITVKRAVDALSWVDTNPHHIVGTEFHETKRDEDGREIPTHLYLQNYHEKLRVPVDLWRQVAKHIRPNKRPFDTRMYAVTRAGKALVAGK